MHTCGGELSTVAIRVFGAATKPEVALGGVVVGWQQTRGGVRHLWVIQRDSVGRRRTSLMVVGNSDG